MSGSLIKKQCIRTALKVELAVIFFFGAVLSEAHKAAERIRNSVKNNTGTTVSIGISHYGKKITQVEEMIKNADEALYLAKNRGKNRVEISD